MLMQFICYVIWKKSKSKRQANTENQIRSTTSAQSVIFFVLQSIPEPVNGIPISPLASKVDQNMQLGFPHGETRQ